MIKKRKKGAITFTPLIYVLVLLGILVSVIFAYKSKAEQIYGRLDDAVTVSCQSICIPDRYVTGAYHWNREDVVFATSGRLESEYYLIDPAIGTNYAADIAYERLKDLLGYNFPSMVTDYVIDEFRLVNIVSGTAYEYDYLSGSQSTWNTAEEESYIEVTISVNVVLPAFGETTWVKGDKVILREE